MAVKDEVGSPRGWLCFRNKAESARQEASAEDENRKHDKNKALRVSKGLVEQQVATGIGKRRDLRGGRRRNLGLLVGHGGKQVRDVLRVRNQRRRCDGGFQGRCIHRIGNRGAGSGRKRRGQWGSSSDRMQRGRQIGGAVPGVLVRGGRVRNRICARDGAHRLNDGDRPRRLAVPAAVADGRRGCRLHRRCGRKRRN